MFDQFTEAYIACALWSTSDSDGQYLSESYGISSISPYTLAAMVEDCQMFMHLHHEKIKRYPEVAGHDFWLTRNRHGAGFWDGDWPKEVGEHLTKSAIAFGEFALYAGADGLIYD